MNAATPAGIRPTVSVVVIGRNEGERLARCLRSVAAADWCGVPHEMIYVDSRSADGSLQRASELGAQALLLDDAQPCAAKARNLGWRAAQGEFVLFLDADTELAPGFVQAALQALREPGLCAAWGHRRESDPGQSLYTRVLDLDWLYPVGRSLYFGGDVLVRRVALEQVGGFDPALKAGEEPELCLRLRRIGWEIEHLDVPMTRHDLGVRTLRAYLLRAYRSGIAYAQVASQARAAGDSLWQQEARRDLVHGFLYAGMALLLAVCVVLQPAAALALAALALLVVARTARRCRWKAPGDPLLAFLYAGHAHAQKLPALAGQLHWRWAGHRRDIALVDYKAPARRIGRGLGKNFMARALQPLARLHRWWIDRGVRLWAFARLQEAIGRPLDASNVVLGPVTVEGTRNVHFGRDALLYPGVVLETQGAGRIEIGDGVVLSRGVHIVAFERVVLEAGCMVGEFSSLRDSDHRTGAAGPRYCGHVGAPVHIGPGAWLGRGVAVLKGVTVGAGSVVGANAVVTRSLPRQIRAAGAPACILRATRT